MTKTPAPILDLVAAKMYDLERDNQELLSLVMAPTPTGWAVQIVTDQGPQDFLMDAFGYTLEDRPPVVPALEVVA